MNLGVGGKVVVVSVSIIILYGDIEKEKSVLMGMPVCLLYLKPGKVDGD